MLAMRIFLFLALFPFCLLLGRVQEDKVPDLALTIQPIAFGASQAVSALFQCGLRDVRMSGTYALELGEGHLVKGTAEYLHEKLGFHFSSGTSHAWVQQYSLGAAYKCNQPFYCLESLEAGGAYSFSPSRTLPSKLVQDDDLIAERRIAGADFASLFVSSRCDWGKAVIGGQLLYDYVKFRRKLQDEKTISGPGAGISFHYPLFSGTQLHLSAELRRPYLFMEGRFGWNMSFFSNRTSASVFIESTKGFSSIPDSTRFGIELSLQFGPRQETLIEGEKYYCVTEAQRYARMPAVYRPQVLAISDERVRAFCEAPRVVRPFGTIAVPLGSFSFDASAYFSGGGPLVFIGTDFPAGFSIDPLSGVISGVADGSQVGMITSEILVINYCGRVTQSVTFAFPPL